MPLSETAEQRFLIRRTRTSRWEALRNVSAGLDAGGLPVADEPSSATVVVSRRGLGPAGSTANETAPASTLTTARTSLLGARPVALLPSQYRSEVPKSQNAARDFFPAPRSEDGII